MMSIAETHTIQQRQQLATARLCLLLTHRLPLCEWNLSLAYGFLSGLADTVEDLRSWANVIAGGIVSISGDGRFLEAVGVEENEGIRLFCLRPEQPVDDDARRVLVKAAELVTEQRAGVVRAITAAAETFSPFGPTISNMASKGRRALAAHLGLAGPGLAAYLTAWEQGLPVEAIAAELRAAARVAEQPAGSAR